MKSAHSDSASEAEAEIRRQQERGQHPFEAILSIVQADRAFSRRAPLFADVDLNLHQLEKAQQLAVQHLDQDGRIRELARPDLKCTSARGFLQSIDELVARALSDAATPSSACYVYNARNYTLTLERRSRISSKRILFQRKKGPKVENTYRDLMNTEFVVINHQSGERTTFELLVGATGQLRGVPVQIVHQPNWWFQVVLNLDSVQSK